MSISAERVSFDDDQMWVALSDGRTLGVPLAWFPRLLAATRRNARRSRRPPSASTGPTSTRIFPVDGLLAGRGDQTVSGHRAA